MMPARADRPATVGGDVLGRTVATLVGGSYVHELEPEVLGALALVTDEHGVTPWAFVRCAGHDAGKHSRLRLRGRDGIVSVEFDTRGALFAEEYEGAVYQEHDENRPGLSAVTYVDTDGAAHADGDPERLRFECPVCGKSGSRHTDTLRGTILAALLRHRQDHQAGKRRPAAMSWWNTPAA